MPKRHTICLILTASLAMPCLSGCIASGGPKSWKLPFTGDKDDSLLSTADDDTGLKLPDLALHKPQLSLGKETPQSIEAKRVKADALYDQANRIFQEASQLSDKARTTKFAEAADKYKAAADASAGTSVEENSLFMVGESYFFANHYRDSIEAFEELVRRYPRTRHIDRTDQRRFAVAQYWEKVAKAHRKTNLVPNFTDPKLPTFDVFGNAIRVYNKIRLDDPTGRLADDATMASGIAHFEAGNYVEANTLFDDLRQNFANSEHQFDAHLLSIKTKMKTYQGPDYDSTMLDDAAKLIKQVTIQFPDKIEPHRETLEKAAKDIRLMKAQELYAEAEYRDRRKEYEAARMAYARVREDFSDTNLALEAESRLAQLGGLPDLPDEPLQWLADIFPEEKRPRPLMASGGLGKKIR